MEIQLLLDLALEFGYSPVPIACLGDVYSLLAIGYSYSNNAYSILVIGYSLFR